ncbi:chromosome segregation protein SMC [Hydrococcus rivularis NIES-593]|uniref:Nuclease SbcCD subunit C n=1 Tax=Hydrococcus rivularis NIES-593 TaxID=1921803 RepID=A0A1U7HCJ3_9CYAN|nr:AAA family ATPase [Hydrococcus rivularis]OKH21289.1 chromosome segregation protein SMC [Hydrococcus rivularis NIES-593]
MGLRLKQIRLKNWKCYREQIVRFNLNTDKNIWIVFGQNGYGKTSLLEAIIWCLYGNEGVLTKKLLDYFNRIALKKRKQLELSVQLNFEENGKNYFISREATWSLRGTTPNVVIGEPTFYEDGTQRKNPREYIDSLLPKSCKEFFFFDGVEIQRYAQLTQTDETRNAIEQILGIPELKNLRDDADKALHQIEKDLNKASVANQDLKQKTDRLEKLQEEIELTTGQLQIAKKSLTEAIKIYEDCQERARQIEDLHDKLQAIDKKEQEKRYIERNLENAEKEVESALRKVSIPLMREFIQEVYDDLQRKNIKKTGLSVSLKQLRDLLNSDRCLCGRCMDDQSRDYIRQQLEELKNVGNLTQEIIEHDELRNQLSGLLQDRPLDLDGILLKRDRIRDDLDELKQSIANLKQDTNGLKRSEVEETWRRVGAEEKNVEAIGERINRLSREIEQKKQEADRLRREIETLAGRDRETATLVKQVRLAEGLRDAANELIEWYIDDRKQTIENHTFDLHRQVTNKPDEYRGVAIAPNYTLRVKTVTGEALNPEILSAGEKEALAFAFITGLNLASETAAPLIMDTPFGHLDMQHQKNIINALPNIPSQVIVLATNRDLPDYLLHELRPHVAEILNISRDATEDMSIVEVRE